MNGVVFASAVFLCGGMVSILTGSIPTHGFIAELVWSGLALAGLITIAGTEASS
ncbi:hypothetical protein FG93_02891 [Bosea sp. LC85]|uniref:hypothetical protein n=1 Tax=Bosea sp. LC85 TaxID=1502851 RepID=UPI0004E2E25D|nr:hypothetical protein [Bosea sp. LC85]KFC70439.1 hypothetical protein FG93_02891 [Bosea sp. LC85]